MKNILVPIDFTKVAFNALEYAINAFPESNILVLHVTPPSLNTTEIKYSLLNRIRTEADVLQDEVKRLIKLELNLEDIPSNLNLIMRKGDILPVINKLSQELAIDTIVMGTRDKYDMFDKIIGTTSLAIIKSQQVPTYLIPKDVKYTPYKKVLVASDYHLLTSSLGRKIKEWNKSFRAYIRFFHVKKGQEKFHKETDQLITDLFDGDAPQFVFDLIQKEGDNIGEMLLNEAESFNANLIVTMPEKQNFISRVFLKSVTKSLVQKSKVPLLFIHPQNILV